MKFVYTTLFIGLLFPVFSIAQTNYKAGYVVTLTGDTLRGFIDYRESAENPKGFHFKNGQHPDKVENLSVKTVGAFGITGFVYFQRFILPISIDQVEVSKLAVQLDTSSRTDTVFFKLLTKGKNLSLFSYTDEIKQRFYLLEKEEKLPQELTYHAYYSPEESSSVHYVNTYRGQLEYIAQKYAVKTSKLDQQILETHYVEPQITKIVQIINGPLSEQFTPPSQSGSRIFAGVGANFSNLIFSEASGNSTGSTTVSNSSSVFPKIAAGIDIFANKSVQKFIIRAEVSFTMNQYNLTNTNSGTPQSTSTLNFKQFNSTLTPQIIYNLYNSDKLKAFLGVGAALNFSFYNHYQYIIKYGGSFADYARDNYPALNSFWIAVPIKAGVTINNKIELSICYAPASSLTFYTGSFINVTSVQAGINYFFGSK